MSTANANTRQVSYDGSKVVYLKNFAGNTDICVKNTDGTGEIRLTTAPGLDFDPAISADGSKVTFISRRSGTDDIYVVNTDGTGETRLTSTPGSEGLPSITGNGSKVCFVMDNGEFATINSDGTGLQQITFGSPPAGKGAPIISDDGTKIAYIGAGLDLRIMNSDGTNDTLVSSSTGGIEFSVSADGNEIAFIGSGSRTYLASYTTTAPQTSSNLLQVSQDNKDSGRIDVGFFDARAAALGVAGVDISSVAGAQGAITTIDAAIAKVSSYRASIGIAEKRLGHVTNDLAAQRINISAARSRIEDTDMAADMSDLTRGQIVAQAASAALAQSNAQPQSVLQLLR